MAGMGSPERPGAESSAEQREAEQENQPVAEGEGERESIWTIPAKLKRWYFALFSIQVVIAAVWLVRTAIVDESRNGIPDILTYLWLNMAPAAVSSATFALVIVDAVNGIMVLSTWLEDELKKRSERRLKAAVEAAVDAAVETAVEKTRNEERQAARLFSKRLRDWNQRREAAVAAGEEFHEPPPDIDDPDNEETQR